MLVRTVESGIIRDTESMALIINDNRAKEEYYNKLQMVKNQKEQINMVTKEIADIRSDMDELKQLMKQLLDRQ
jgi:K+/H+ antiporter YhaU regulatory subunit KhtT